MKQYKILFTKQAVKDAKSLPKKQLKKLKDIIEEVISINPERGKRLLGNFKGNYSYRLNLKDRIIYSTDKKENVIYIKRCRTHYSR